MLQRVQTIYLGIAIILLGIVSTGSTFFSFVTESNRHSFNAFGITTSDVKTNAITAHNGMLFIVGIIALALLSFICLMSYKNLNRQFKLGRTVFMLYFAGVVGIVVLSFMGDTFVDEPIVKRELGAGFYLFIAGFPFTFLANIGIKRDKRLLDSLDRLR